jgi:hypothetical protein
MQNLPEGMTEIMADDALLDAVGCGHAVPRDELTRTLVGWRQEALAPSTIPGITTDQALLAITVGRRWRWMPLRLQRWIIW